MYLDHTTTQQHQGLVTALQFEKKKNPTASVSSLKALLSHYEVFTVTCDM